MTTAATLNACGSSSADLRPLIQEIETWVEALEYYDNNEFDKALQTFEKIADTSKILFNMGVINATLGQHEEAVRIHNTSVASQRPRLT